MGGAEGSSGQWRRAYPWAGGVRRVPEHSFRVDVTMGMGERVGGESRAETRLELALSLAVEGREERLGGGERDREFVSL